jgi:hypothetical protein
VVVGLGILLQVVEEMVVQAVAVVLETIMEIVAQVVAAQYYFTTRR